MTPEFSRPYPRDRVGNGAIVLVEATPAECAALAVRMGLPEVRAFSCTFDLQRAQGKRVPATGRLQARIVQTCVMSLDTFEAGIDENFAIRFVPRGTESDDLNLDEIDEIPYEGDVIDLGEAASEQLALSLDPFPRKPGATLPEEGDGDGSEAKGAFAALGKLRQRG